MADTDQAPKRPAVKSLENALVAAERDVEDERIAVTHYRQLADQAETKLDETLARRDDIKALLAEVTG